MERLKKKEEMRKTLGLLTWKLGGWYHVLGRKGRKNVGLNFSGARSLLCPKVWEFPTPLFKTFFCN